MKRPKISRRAETRPYGRVSAPTGNCRKFLTQLDSSIRFSVLLPASGSQSERAHSTRPMAVDRARSRRSSS